MLDGDVTHVSFTCTTNLPERMPRNKNTVGLSSALVGAGWCPDGAGVR